MKKFFALIIFSLSTITTLSGCANTSHTIIWKNVDNTVLEVDWNVPHGTLPTYDGELPTEAVTTQVTYS